MALHNYIYFKHSDKIAEQIARPHDPRPILHHVSSHDELDDIELKFDYADFDRLQIDVDQDLQDDVDRSLDKLEETVALHGEMLSPSNTPSIILGDDEIDSNTIINSHNNNDNSHNSENTNINVPNDAYSHSMGINMSMNRKGSNLSREFETSHNPLLLNYLSNMNAELERQYNQEFANEKASSMLVQQQESGGESNSSTTTNTFNSNYPSSSSVYTSDEIDSIQLYHQSSQQQHAHAHAHHHHHHHHHHANPHHHHHTHYSHHNQKDQNSQKIQQNFDHNSNIPTITGNLTSNNLRSKNLNSNGSYHSNMLQDEEQYNFNEYQTSNFVKSVVVPPITASLPMSVRMARTSSSRSSMFDSFGGTNGKKSKGNSFHGSQNCGSPREGQKKKRKLASRFSKKVQEKRQTKGIKDVRNTEVV